MKISDRRNFLKYSTLAGLGIAFNPFAASSKDKITGEDNQMRLKKWEKEYSQ